MTDNNMKNLILNSPLCKQKFENDHRSGHNPLGNRFPLMFLK